MNPSALIYTAPSNRLSYGHAKSAQPSGCLLEEERLPGVLDYSLTNCLFSIAFLVKPTSPSTSSKAFLVKIASHTNEIQKHSWRKPPVIPMRFKSVRGENHQSYQRDSRAFMAKTTSHTNEVQEHSWRKSPVVLMRFKSNPSKIHQSY